MIRHHILRRPLIVALSLALGAPLAVFSGQGISVTPAAADEVPGLADARAAHGLQVLHLDRTLQRVAQDQANYMAAAGNMSHVTAPGLDFGSRMIQSGFGQKASENIGRGRLSDRQIVSAWMNSTNHRNNMLNPNYSHYGFASAADPANPGTHYWSMVTGL